ncbi:MAG: iron ABC transporter permease [Deltaproteobacteria bacterium]|nr:iron ABC transporter permease [Deltaproteobacteria bacterium]
MAWTLAGGLLALAIVPPLTQVARGLLGGSGQLSSLAAPRIWVLLGRSVLLAGAVTAVALVAGVTLGVSFAKASFPGRRLLLALHVLIAFLPPFLPALGWFRLVGRSGFVGSESLSRVLFSGTGAVLVLATCLTPIVTALTWLGLHSIDPSLEDAARLVGRPLRTVFAILLPIASRAIALSGLIVFALALSELGVPMFLRVDVYPAVVFSRLGGMDFAPGEAAVFMLPLLATSLVLFGIEHLWIGRKSIASLGIRSGERSAVFRGRARIAAALVAAVGALVSVAPVAGLAAHATAGRGWADMVRWAGDAPVNTLRAAGAAALLCTAVAVVAGHAAARGRGFGRAMDALASLGFLVPSTIIGVGLIATWNRPWTAWLYTSFGILVVGFAAKYAIIGCRTLEVVIAQMPSSLEEAGESVGASYFRRLWGIVVRGNARGTLGALTLVLAFCMRDLETAVLFYPPGGEPLTVRIFTLEANGPPAVVSALALLQVAMTGAALAATAALLHRRRIA